MKRSAGAGIALLLLAALATPAAAAASPAAPSGAVTPSGPAADLASADVGATSATAASSTDLTTLGLGGWQVQSSATASQGGAAISSPGFATGNWLKVLPDDAGAPGTEIGALLQNGACPNVFYSDNMRKCFGYESGVGPETVPRFSVPWWFRTDFHADPAPGRTASLVVNGVVGKADVWVDGHEVATSATVTGDFTRFTFDVGSLLRPGTNSLAIEVHPNDPNSMFTLDDVDWTEVPPDNNTGIQFPVQLATSAALSAGNAHVVQDDAADLSSAALTVKTDVTNHTGSARTGLIRATVTPPRGAGAPITVTEPVTVPAHTTTTVAIGPAQDPRLRIAHPRVWWPYQMGAQPMYGFDTAVSAGGAVSATHGTFGIRTVTSTLVGKSAEAPDGVRQYAVNGRPFVVRGGGYSEDLFLRYSAADVARQIALMRNLGINAVRTEGHVMPDDFYRQMDAAGIMIDAGYQCCDAWQPTDPPSSADLAVLRNSALTIGQNLRDHPSVITFSWSDNEPLPTQEAVSLDAFHQADFDVPLVASAEYKSSPQLGPSGEKEGPYDWVPPVYWYDTGHYDPSDPSRTNVGGAWGLDSEQSAGDTVPTLDSLQRFLSPTEQNELWQNPDYHQYHANYESGHGGYAFGTLYDFDTALRARYGPWSSLPGYVQEAQAAEYENVRAQFEAFLANSVNQPTPATGTIYWQLNKGWPTLLWDLYNNDGDQPGSFFGAKKADEPLHVLYTDSATGPDTVAVDNLGGSRQSGLSVEAKVYDTAGNLLDDQHTDGIGLNSQGVVTGLLTPKVPAATAAPTPARTYFVELLLRRHGQIVDRNVYWRSTQPDVVDWAATEGNPQATMSQYADLSGLRSLGQATIGVSASTRRAPGPDGADTVTAVRVTNTSTTPVVGFLLRADLRRGSASGVPAAGDNEVGSALWSDNDITLWPGESQTLTVSYAARDLHGASPVVSLSGWNAPARNVPAVGGE